VEKKFEVTKHVFHTANDSSSASHAAGKHATELTKSEFLEAVCRLAVIYQDMLVQNSNAPRDLPFQKVVAQFLEKVVRPQFEDKFALNPHLREMMSDENVLALLGRNQEPLTLVYKYFAVSDIEESKPTMNFDEFHALCAAAGLIPPKKRKDDADKEKSMYELDQEIDKILEIERSQQQQQQAVHVVRNTTSGHVNSLTEQQVRHAFSLSQQDSELDTEETSDLCFTEFIESLGRLALQKWDTKALRPAEKMEMALEAVIGVERSIPEKAMVSLRPAYRSNLQNRYFLKNLGKVRKKPLAAKLNHQLLAAPAKLVSSTRIMRVRQHSSAHVIPHNSPQSRLKLDRIEPGSCFSAEDGWSVAPWEGGSQYDEYLKVKQKSEQQVWREMFEKIDGDGNGTIDKGEFSKYLSGQGIAHDVDDIRSFFQEFDADGGGDLDIDEFIRMMQSNAQSILKHALAEDAGNLAMPGGLLRKVRKAKGAIGQPAMKMNYSYSVA
jgi:hypothetical protein